MPRGGYQKPGKPAAVSGVGKNSKRTDGGVQPVREPDIDTMGLEYGDRKMVSDAQRIAPLPKPGSGAGRLPTGAPPQGGAAAGLPPWLIDSPSNRPDEPVTAGLGMGPGPGPEILDAAAPAPDVREQTLEALWVTFNNPQARDLLMQLRQEKAAATAGPGMAPPTEAPVG